MKKQMINKHWAIIAIATLLMAFLTENAFATPITASGVEIANQAKVNFKVATIAQPQVPSNTYKFLVDTIVDLTVTAPSSLSVTPGATGQILQFKVANTGNHQQGFNLTVANVASGDDFDTTNLTVFAESGATAGYQLAEDTNTEVNHLNANTEVNVYVISDIPVSRVDDDEAIISVVAQAMLTTDINTAEANDDGVADNANADNIEVVWGDGIGPYDDQANPDGKHSAGAKYVVQGADVTISKTTNVISDPINGTTNPKRIPGAIIEYVITVTNDAAASSTATNVEVTDDLSAEIDTNKTLAFVTKYDADNLRGISISNPRYDSGNYHEFTNASDVESPIMDGVQAEFNTTTFILKVSELTLAAGQTAVIKFKVEIL